MYDIKYAHRDVRRIKAARATETFDAVVADLVGDVSPVSANGQKDGCVAPAPCGGVVRPPRHSRPPSAVSVSPRYYGKIFSSRRKYMDSTDGGYT